MPKIEDPLRQGETSRVYYLTYPRGISGYEIAQKLGLKYPSVVRILKGMKKKGLISRQKTRLPRRAILNRARVEPLFERIKAMLESSGVQLSDEESKILQHLLDSKEFRFLVGAAQEDVKKGASALDSIITTLCMVIGALQGYEKIKGEIENEAGVVDFEQYVKKTKRLGEEGGSLILDQDLDERVAEEAQAVLGQEGLKRAPKGILQSPSRLLESVFPFTALPQPLVDKLAGLSPVSEVISFMMETIPKMGSVIDEWGERD